MHSNLTKSATREYVFLFIYQKLNNNVLECLTSDDLDQNIIDFDDSYNFNEDLDLKNANDNSRDHVKKNRDQQLSIHLIKNSISNVDDLILTINKSLKKKDFKQLNKIEQALLLAALSENKSIKETPKAVIISEYIKLAEIYSNNISSKFLNGILDAIL